MRSAFISRVLSILITIVLTLGTISATGEEREGGTCSLLSEEIMLEADGTIGPFLLPDRFLLFGTEHVRVDDRLLIAGKDYQLNADDGRITFSQPPSVSSVIRIQYQKLPFVLRGRYFHRLQPLQEALSQLQPQPLPSNTPADKPLIPPALKVGGSKTFAISLGSERDLSLEQSLRVNISGQISPDVEVVALLSDQSSPLQPEGDTQTLEEIDKVLVEIRSPKATATLGDYEISYGQGEFGQFERKLQGAKGTAQARWGQITAAGAVSKGTFRSISFSGIEGKQGPYQLTDQQGGTDIIILAGTERVWMDGERVTRGQNNDYVIEYGSGEITFTLHRLITAESRIVVDYEYSSRQYQRSFYGGHGGLSLLGDRIKLSTLIVREADDRDSPIDITLSAEDRDVLQRAGDDPRNAWRDGWTLADTAASEKGDYVWIDSTHFEYVGPDSNGLYFVVFSDVGPEEGQYSRKFSLENNRYYYVYLGEGEQRYLPRVYLPLPSNHSMADFRTQLEPWSGAQLSVELGISHRDENSFSDLEDDDNTGRGIALEGKISRQSLRLGSQELGQLDLTGRYRSTNDHFRAIGRTEEVEYYRRWNLDRDRAFQAEEVREISGRYQPLKVLSLGGEYGRLERGETFSSTRRRIESEFSASQWPHLKAYHEIINSQQQGISLEDTVSWQSTRWRRQGMMTDYAIWKVRPLFSWEAESRESEHLDQLTSGERFEKFRGGLSSRDLGALTISLELIYRQDHLYEGRWLRKTLGRTLKSSAELKNWRSLSWATEYTRRVLRFQEVPGTNSQVDLIQSKISYSPLMGAVRAQMDYQVSNTQGSQKRRIPVEVGEGQGEYRLEDGEYIPDPEGNWIFHIETVGDSIPVTDLAVGLRLGLVPHRAIHEGSGGLWGLMRHLSTDTYVKIDEQTTESNKMAIYLLQLSKFQRDESTLRGEITFQQDLFLFPQRRDVSIRLRYQTTDRENNQYITGGEENLRIARSVRLDLAPGNRPVLRLEYEHQNQFRKMEGIPKSRIRADDLSAEGTVYPHGSMEMSLRMEYRGDQDAVGQTSSRLTALTPKVSYSFLSQGRLRSEFTWAHVSVDPEGGTISWEMAQGNRVGSNYRWSLSADYQMNQYASATVSYTLRVQPDRPAQHLGRAEMRAFF